MITGLSVQVMSAKVTGAPLVDGHGRLVGTFSVRDITHLSGSSTESIRAAFRTNVMDYLTAHKGSCVLPTLRRIDSFATAVMSLSASRA